MSDLTPEALDTIEARANDESADIQADLNAGNVSVFADYLVLEVGEHTCGGGTAESNYMHEKSCGLEPIAPIVDLVRGATREEAKALVSELRRLRTENKRLQNAVNLNRNRASEYRAAERQVERENGVLRGTLAAAPHERQCLASDWNDWNPDRTCTCWKSRAALTGEATE